MKNSAVRAMIKQQYLLDDSVDILVEFLWVVGDTYTYRVNFTSLDKTYTLHIDITNNQEVENLNEQSN